MRITYLLMAINVFVFILQIAFGQLFSLLLALRPELAFSGFYWQFLTYMFLHADLFHITFNMFFLYLFGLYVETALGPRRFLSLYLVSGIGAALFFIALSGFISGPLVGASGAIFGVLAAFGFMFPDERIIIFPVPYPLPAWVAIVLIALLELGLGFSGVMPEIANFGHFGGIITGLLFTLYFKGRKPKGADEMKNFEFFWQ